MACFLVYLEPADGGGYIVSATAPPSYVMQEKTKEEELATIKDTINGYIWGSDRRLTPIPYPVWGVTLNAVFHRRLSDRRGNDG